MIPRVLILLGSVLLASCGGGEPSSDLPRGISETTITVGSHTDLSGPLAVWGVPHINGMRMRFNEVEAAGGIHGRSIDFVVEDSQYQVPVAVKAVNKLLNVDEIFVMLGAMGTPHNQATFERLFEANVPSLFPLTAARSMYEPHHPMKFGYFVSYQNQARGAIRYMVEQHDYKRICLQAMASDYGAEVLEGYEMVVEELGLESVYVGRHKVSETDFVGTATSIKNSNCEMLFLGPFIKDTILLYTALRDAGWDNDIVANMVPYLPEIASAGNGDMNGLYSVAPVYIPNFDTDATTPWAEQWHKSYGETYGEGPAAQSVMGYVIADLLVKSIEAAGPDLTVEKMLAALEAVDGYEDPFGGPPLSFSADKHVAGNFLNLYQVVDGKWKTVVESLEF